jgi:hypothetical protein
MGCVSSLDPLSKRHGTIRGQSGTKTERNPSQIGRIATLIGNALE